MKCVYGKLLWKLFVEKLFIENYCRKLFAENYSPYGWIAQNCLINRPWDPFLSFSTIWMFILRDHKSMKWSTVRMIVRRGRMAIISHSVNSVFMLRNWNSLMTKSRIFVPFFCVIFIFLMCLCLSFEESLDPYHYLNVIYLNIGG